MNATVQCSFIRTGCCFHTLSGKDSNVSLARDQLNTAAQSEQEASSCSQLDQSAIKKYLTGLLECNRQEVHPITNHPSYKAFYGPFGRYVRYIQWIQEIVPFGRPGYQFESIKKKQHTSASCKVMRIYCYSSRQWFKIVSLHPSSG